MGTTRALALDPGPAALKRASLTPHSPPARPPANSLRRSARNPPPLRLLCCESTRAHTHTHTRQPSPRPPSSSPPPASRGGNSGLCSEQSGESTRGDGIIVERRPSPATPCGHGSARQQASRGQLSSAQLNACAGPGNGDSDSASDSASDSDSEGEGRRRASLTAAGAFRRAL